MVVQCACRGATVGLTLGSIGDVRPRKHSERNCCCPRSAGRVCRRPRFLQGRATGLCGHAALVLQVRLLPQGLQEVQPPEAARAVAHRREALQVQALRARLRLLRRAQVPREDAHRSLSARRRAWGAGRGRGVWLSAAPGVTQPPPPLPSSGTVVSHPAGPRRPSEPQPQLALTCCFFGRVSLPDSSWEWSPTAGGPVAGPVTWHVRGLSMQVWASLLPAAAPSRRVGGGRICALLRGGTPEALRSGRLHVGFCVPGRGWGRLVL